MISTILSAIGIIFVARLLGAKSFGFISVALIPAGFATLFLDWGVTSALIKYLAQSRHEDKLENRLILIESAMLFNILVGATLSIALFVASPFLAQNIFKQPEIEILIKYSSLSIIGNSFLRISWAVTVGYERMQLRIGTTIIYSLLKSITGPILIYLGYGPVGAILGESGPVFLSGIAGLIFIWVIWRSETPMKPSMTHIEGMTVLLRYGYPLFFSMVIVGVIPSFTNYLLAMNVSNELIGNYTAGIRFSALVSFFSMPISTVMFPLFSKLENDHNALKTIYQNSVKLTALLILPVALVVIALADPIVAVLYDQGYEHTPLFLKIYMLGFILPGFGSINTAHLLNGLRETHVNLRAGVVSFLTTVPLSFLLISRYGVVGLIVATISGYTITLAYRLFWVQNHLGFTIIWKSSIKTLLAATASYIASTFLLSTIQTRPWIELFLGGLLYLVTYFAGVIALGILSPTDLDFIETLLENMGLLSHVFTRFIDTIRRLCGYK